MPQYDAQISIGAQFDDKSLTSQVERAVSRLPYATIKTRLDPTGLGQISRQAEQFTRSLEAANARVLSFSLSAGSLYGLIRAFEAIKNETVQVQKALTEINLVLNLSSTQLQKYGSSLITIANQTASSFKETAKVALEFSRAGAGLEQSLIRTKDVMTLARISGVQLEDAIKGIIVGINAFSAANLNSTELINKFASVNGRFVVGIDDLVKGLERAGITAAESGVSIDKLIGIITAAKTATERSGDIIGRAVNSIFAKIQQPQVLSQIKEMGVEVEDLQGNLKSADQILVGLAKAYNTASQEGKTFIASLAGGSLMANQLRAVLSDLSKENSVYQRASQAAANATNEAIVRQAQYNKTLAATLTEMGNNAVAAAAKIGSLTLEPFIRQVAKLSNVITTGLTGGGEEGIGTQIAVGVLRGFGNYLSGPGIALLGVIAAKFFLSFTSFAKDALGTVIETLGGQNKAQLAINELLARQPSLWNDINRGALTQEQIQTRILGLIDQELVQATKLSAALAAGTALVQEPGLIGALTTAERPLAIKGRGLAYKSVGLIPDAMERAGAYAGGYTPGQVKSINIPNLGPIVYNTAEQVRNFPQFTQPAILPPQASLAGTNYKQNFQSIHGFNPYVAGGLIPNYAFSIGDFPPRFEDKIVKAREKLISSNLYLKDYNIGVGYAGSKGEVLGEYFHPTIYPIKVAYPPRIDLFSKSLNYDFPMFGPENAPQHTLYHEYGHFIDNLIAQQEKLPVRFYSSSLNKDRRLSKSKLSSRFIEPAADIFPAMVKRVTEGNDIESYLASANARPFNRDVVSKFSSFISDYNAGKFGTVNQILDNYRQFKFPGGRAYDGLIPNYALKDWVGGMLIGGIGLGAIGGGIAKKIITDENPLNKPAFSVDWQTATNSSIGQQLQEIGGDKRIRAIRKKFLGGEQIPLRIVSNPNPYYGGGYNRQKKDIEINTNSKYSVGNAIYHEIGHKLDFEDRLGLGADSKIINAITKDAYASNKKYPNELLKISTEGNPYKESFAEIFSRNMQGRMKEGTNDLSKFETYKVIRELGLGSDQLKYRGLIPNFNLETLKIAMRLPDGQIIKGRIKERMHAQIATRLVNENHPNVVGESDPDIESGWVNTAGKFITNDEVQKLINYKPDSFGSGGISVPSFFPQISSQEAAQILKSKKFESIFYQKKGGESAWYQDVQWRVKRDQLVGAKAPEGYNSWTEFDAGTNSLALWNRKEGEEGKKFRRFSLEGIKKIRANGQEYTVGAEGLIPNCADFPTIKRFDKPQPFGLNLFDDEFGGRQILWQAPQMKRKWRISYTSSNKEGTDIDFLGGHDDYSSFKKALKSIRGSYIGTYTNKSKGLIPNYNALSQAIARENKAGVPLSLIRVSQSPRLEGPLNPLGLGVSNVRDEPHGLSQGINRYANLGLDPKTAGIYAKGIIPNYAPNLQSTAPGQIGINYEAEALVEFNKTKEALKYQSIGLNEATNAAKETAKSFLLTDQSLKSMIKSLEAVNKPGFLQSKLNNLESRSQLNIPSGLAQSIGQSVKQGLNEIASKTGPNFTASNEYLASIKAKNPIILPSVIPTLTSKTFNFTPEQIQQALQNQPGLAKVINNIENPKIKERYIQDFIKQGLLSIPNNGSTTSSIGFGNVAIPGLGIESFYSGIGARGANSKYLGALNSLLSKFTQEIQSGALDPASKAAKQMVEGFVKSAEQSGLIGEELAAFEKQIKENIQQRINIAGPIGQNLVDVNNQKIQIARSLEQKASQIGFSSLLFPFLNTEGANANRNLRYDDEGKIFRARRIDQLKNQALLSSFVIPAVGGVVQQGLTQLGLDQSPKGRGTIQAVGGLANIASFTQTGFGLGGPYGAYAGFGLGLITELPKIITAFTDSLPDLQKELEKITSQTQRTTEKFLKFTEVSERLNQIRLGESNVTPQQKRQLQQSQLELLTSIPAPDRKRILELETSGQGTKAAELLQGIQGRNFSTQQQQSFITLAEQLRQERPNRTLTELKEGVLEFLPGGFFGSLFSNVKGSIIKGAGEAAVTIADYKSTAQLVPASISTLLNLTNAKNESFYDIVSKNPQTVKQLSNITSFNELQSQLTTIIKENGLNGDKFLSGLDKTAKQNPVFQGKEAISIRQVFKDLADQLDLDSKQGKNLIQVFGTSRIVASEAAQKFILFNEKIKATAEILAGIGQIKLQTLGNTFQSFIQNQNVGPKTQAILGGAVEVRTIQAERQQAILDAGRTLQTELLGKSTNLNIAEIIKSVESNKERVFDLPTIVQKAIGGAQEQVSLLAGNNADLTNPAVVQKRLKALQDNLKVIGSEVSLPETQKTKLTNFISIIESGTEFVGRYRGAIDKIDANSAGKLIANNQRVTQALQTIEQNRLISIGGGIPGLANVGTTYQNLALNRRFLDSNDAILKGQGALGIANTLKEFGVENLPKELQNTLIKSQSLYLSNVAKTLGIDINPEKVAKLQTEAFSKNESTQAKLLAAFKTISEIPKSNEELFKPLIDVFSGKQDLPVFVKNFPANFPTLPGAKKEIGTVFGTGGTSENYVGGSLFGKSIFNAVKSEENSPRSSNAIYSRAILDALKKNDLQTDGSNILKPYNGGSLFGAGILNTPKPYNGGPLFSPRILDNGSRLGNIDFEGALIELANALKSFKAPNINTLGAYSIQGSVAEEQKNINQQIQIELNKQRINSAGVGFSSDQTNSIRNLNTLRASLGQNTGGIRDIEYGRSFFSELSYSQNDFFKDFANNIQDTGKEFRDMFRSAFTEAGTGAKTLGQAMRDAALQFGKNIASRSISSAVGIGTSYLGSGLESIANLFSGNKSKTTQTLGSFYGGLIPGYARGGYVNQGSGVRDDVPALLEGGEFVIKKSSAQQISPATLTQLNNLSDTPGPKAKDVVSVGAGGINALFANEYYGIGSKTRPSKGVLNVSPLLSDLALTSDLNPQNRLRLSRERYFLDRNLEEIRRSKVLQEWQKKRLTTLAISIAAAAVSAAGAAYGNSVGGTLGQDISAATKGFTDIGKEAYSASQGKGFQGDNKNFNDFVRQILGFNKKQGQNQGSGLRNDAYGETYGESGVANSPEAEVFGEPTYTPGFSATLSPDVTRFNGGFIRAYAKGGSVIFGGDSARDRVKALLSQGEYVINRNSVARIGVPALQEINRTGRVPAFNAGGYVGSAYRTDTSTPDPSNSRLSDLMLQNLTVLQSIRDNLNVSTQAQGSRNVSSSKNAKDVANQSGNNAITNNISISVSVQSDGSQNAKISTNTQDQGNTNNQLSAEQAKGFANTIRANVLETIRQENRPGGLLYLTYKTRA